MAMLADTPSVRGSGYRPGNELRIAHDRALDWAARSFAELCSRSTCAFATSGCRDGYVTSFWPSHSTRSKKTCHRAFRSSLSTWPRYKRFRRCSVLPNGENTCRRSGHVEPCKVRSSGVPCVGLALAATKPASAWVTATAPTITGSPLPTPTTVTTDRSGLTTTRHFYGYRPFYHHRFHPVPKVVVAAVVAEDTAGYAGYEPEQMAVEQIEEMRGVEARAYLRQAVLDRIASRTNCSMRR
jgi:hypothetical protein